MFLTHLESQEDPKAAGLVECVGSWLNEGVMRMFHCRSFVQTNGQVGQSSGKGREKGKQEDRKRQEKNDREREAQRKLD